MEVTIVVATCGAEHWADLAAMVAIPSAVAAGAEHVIPLHRSDRPLHAVRNAAAAMAATEWLVFLDADDELEPGYLEALDAPDVLSDLRAPSVRYVPAPWETLEVADPLPDPISLADRDIARTNPCVIGTAIRRDLFLDLGGFWEWPAWEDWCLFRRAAGIGATLEHVPRAVYRAHVRRDSRNAVPPDLAPRLHRQIRARHTEWLRERNRRR